METLLEVGFVEVLAAGVFIGFCLFINGLMKPRQMSERELKRLMDQVAEPERSFPEQLTYRGVPYQHEEEEGDRPAPAPSVPENRQSTSAPDSTVRLTYRGVSYIKPWFKRNKKS